MEIPWCVRGVRQCRGRTLLRCCGGPCRPRNGHVRNGQRRCLGCGGYARAGDGHQRGADRPVAGCAEAARRGRGSVRDEAGRMAQAPDIDPHSQLGHYAAWILGSRYGGALRSIAGGGPCKGAQGIVSAARVVERALPFPRTGSMATTAVSSSAGTWCDIFRSERAKRGSPDPGPTTKMTIGTWSRRTERMGGSSLGMDASETRVWWPR